MNETVQVGPGMNYNASQQYSSTQKSVRPYVEVGANCY